MKVLITGATGLIGKQIGLALAQSEQNHEVVVLARNPDKARLELPFPCEIYKWDLFEGEAPKEAFDGVDAVVHLAGYPISSGRWTKERKNKIVQSRVIGTRHIAQTIAGLISKPKVFLSASGISYYPFSETETFDESSLPGDSFLSDVCKKWERESLEVKSIDETIRHIMIRIGLVLSAEGGALDKMIPFAQEGILGSAGSGQQWMSWIHIDDLVSLIVKALTDSNMQGVYNGVSPHPVTNQDFTKSLMSRFKKKPFLPAPSFALKLFYGQMSQLILQGQKVLPARAEDSGMKFRFSKIDDALEDLFPEHRDGEKRVLYKQWVPEKLDKVFSFYKDEKNLERITPQFLNFKIIGKSTPNIQKGTLLDYRLKLKGIPFQWQTLIKEFEENEFFVDTQKKGPYAKWFHTHRFVPMGHGTLVEDEVIYKLPFGKLGRLAAGWMVRGDVQKIFAYRRKVMGQVFYVGGK